MISRLYIIPRTGESAAGCDAGSDATLPELKVIDLLGHFTQASAVQTKSGFTIKRWQFRNGNADRKDTVELVQESVERNGAYKQTVLKTRKTPNVPHANLIVPMFE